MPDNTLSQALKEAYASAPSNIIIYDTIELRHPAFTAPIRVVRDTSDLVATLEATAPVNPSTAVTFIGFAFNFSRPEVITNGLPQVTLEIDNVDRAIVANLEAALTTTDVIELTYRQFISSNLSAPQNNPPLTMTILSAKATVFRVSAVAGFRNLMNARFPRLEYDAQKFPGLAA
jgi:hypothetical protein